MKKIYLMLIIFIISLISFNLVNATTYLSQDFGIDSNDCLTDYNMNLKIMTAPNVFSCKVNDSVLNVTYNGYYVQFLLDNVLNSVTSKNFSIMYKVKFPTAFTSDQFLSIGYQSSESSGFIGNTLNYRRLLADDYMTQSGNAGFKYLDYNKDSWYYVTIQHNETDDNYYMNVNNVSFGNSFNADITLDRFSFHKILNSNANILLDWVIIEDGFYNAYDYVTENNFDVPTNIYGCPFDKCIYFEDFFYSELLPYDMTFYGILNDDNYNLYLVDNDYLAFDNSDFDNFPYYTHWFSTSSEYNTNYIFNIEFAIKQIVPIDESINNDSIVYKLQFECIDEHFNQLKISDIYFEFEKINNYTFDLNVYHKKSGVFEILIRDRVYITTNNIFENLNKNIQIEYDLLLQKYKIKILEKEYSFTGSYDENIKTSDFLNLCENPNKFTISRQDYNNQSNSIELVLIDKVSLTYYNISDIREQFNEYSNVDTNQFQNLNSSSIFDNNIGVMIHDLADIFGMDDTESGRFLFWFIICGIILFFIAKLPIDTQSKGGLIAVAFIILFILGWLLKFVSNMFFIFLIFLLSIIWAKYFYYISG